MPGVLAPEVLADPIRVVVDLVARTRAGAGPLDSRLASSRSVAGGRAKATTPCPGPARRATVLDDGRSPAPRAVGDLLIALNKAGATRISAPVCAECDKHLRTLQRRGDDWYCAVCGPVREPCGQCGRPPIHTGTATDNHAAWRAARRRVPRPHQPWCFAASSAGSAAPAAARSRRCAAEPSTSRCARCAPGRTTPGAVAQLRPTRTVPPPAVPLLGHRRLRELLADDTDTIPADRQALYRALAATQRPGTLALGSTKAPRPDAAPARRSAITTNTRRAAHRQDSRAPAQHPGRRGNPAHPRRTHDATRTLGRRRHRRASRSR